MAYSVNWIAKEITIPTTDLTLISGTRYSLSMFNFLAEVRRLEWEGSEGLWAPAIVDHSDTRTDFAGANYAAFDDIINGYTVQFSGAATRVDLLDSNNNLIDALVATGVSVVPSNSAGLSYSREIQNQSFTDGRVFVDTVNGSAGVDFPRGTTVSPTSNLSDADTIISSRNLPKAVKLNGSLTLVSEDISGYEFSGGAATHDTIDLGSATTSGAVFRDLRLQGTANGIIHAKDCILAGLSDFEGFLVGGAVGGTVSLAGETHIVNAHAAATGTDSVTLDFQGNAVEAFIPGWEGSMIITNHSHASALTNVNVKGGTITVDSSCTDGTIVLTGSGRPIDNSGSGCNVINQLVDPAITTRLGMNKGDPLVDNNSYGIVSQSGEVDVARTGDGVTTSTLTRQ